MSVDVTLKKIEKTTVYETSTTGNLYPMLKEAGIDLQNYDGIRGKDVLEHLTSCLLKMIIDPERYKALNPVTGWGNYDNAVQWLAKLIVEIRLDDSLYINVF